MFRLLVLSLVVFLGLSLLPAPELFAQNNNRERRQQLVQELLKGLIDSQLDPDDHEDDHEHAFPEGRLPGAYPRMEIPGLPARPQPAEPTARILNVRRQLALMSRQCDELIVEIREHESEIPQLRALLGDTLQIKATLDLLARQSEQSLTIEPLLPRYAAFDRNWRVLNHRLSQVRGLAPECRRCFEELHRMETELCGVFGIEPQVDRLELAKLTTALGSNIEHLLQDIYYDWQGEEHQEQLMRQGQALYSRLVQATPVVQRGSYEEMVTVFKGGHDEWRQFSRSLRAHETPRIARDIQNIEAIGAEIRDRLWLPVELDRRYVADVVGTIDHHVERLLGQITMADLLNCESPGVVLGAARDFRKNCTDFSAGINSNQSVEDLLWSYQNFENQWKDLNQQFAVFTAPGVRSGCDDVAESMIVLRETFGGGPVINRATLMNICADLDQLSHELSDQIHEHVSRQKYAGLHNEILGSCDRLHRRCHELHEHIISTRSDNYEIQKFAVPVFQEWLALKPLMNQCDESDRREFAVVRSRIEPLIVKLQVAYLN